MRFDRGEDDLTVERAALEAAHVNPGSGSGSCSVMGRPLSHERLDPTASVHDTAPAATCAARGSFNR